MTERRNDGYLLVISNRKGRRMKYRLKRNSLEGGQARGQADLQGGQAGGQVEFEGAKWGEKLIRNLTQTSVSPYLDGIAYAVYRRGPSLPTSPNLKYHLTELGEITLKGMNEI
jgi:hypothetical protein